MVQHSPTGAGDEIPQPQHEAPCARRAGAPPLAEHRCHHLPADRPRELEVALVVDAAQLRGLHAEEQLEIVVAHVLEVPACADVAWHARLPPRVMSDEVPRRVGEHLLDRRIVGDVGESQALRREAHLGTPGVLERPPVSTDAVVVGDSLRSSKRQLAAAWRRGHIERLRAALAHQAGQQLAEQLTAPQRRVEPEHRNLLLDLAVAAQDREAGAP